VAEEFGVQPRRPLVHKTTAGNDARDENQRTIAAVRDAAAVRLDARRAERGSQRGVQTVVRGRPVQVTAFGVAKPLDVDDHDQVICRGVVRPHVLSPRSHVGTPPVQP
jgi:hypothetical protein